MIRDGMFGVDVRRKGEQLGRSHERYRRLIGCTWLGKRPVRDQIGFHLTVHTRDGLPDLQAGEPHLMTYELCTDTIVCEGGVVGSQPAALQCLARLHPVNPRCQLIRLISEPKPRAISSHHPGPDS